MLPLRKVTCWVVEKRAVLYGKVARCVKVVACLVHSLIKYINGVIICTYIDTVRCVGDACARVPIETPVSNGIPNRRSHLP